MKTKRPPLLRECLSIGASSANIIHHFKPIDLLQQVYTYNLYVAGANGTEDGKEEVGKTGDWAVGMCQDVRTSGFFCPSFLDSPVSARCRLASDCGF